ncbi:putative glucitol transport protein GutA [Spirochaetia bacterium]|nr:putative glucitol transport protein GutA [Spirochaetia bacterium]
MTEKKVKEKNPDRLLVGKFFAWKSRDVSLAAVTVVMGFLTMFCTDYLGLPAALMGTLLLAGRVIDAVTDLAAGFLVDNTRTRWGKGRPYEFCIIGAWLCTMLLFFCPPSWNMTLKCVWVVVMYNFVFSIFQTLLGAANTAYIIRAFSGNRKVITKVASFGGIVTMFGGMAVSITFPMLMATLTRAEGGWRTLIMIYAIPLTFIGMLRFIFVKEDPSIDAGATAQKISLKDIFTMLKTNKYAWFMAVIMGMLNLTVGMNVGTYYFKYVIGNIALMGPFAMLSIFVLPVMFFFPLLMRKLSVSNLIQLGAALGITGYLICFFAVDKIPFLLAGGFLITMSTMPISYLQALVIMQLANYNEWQGHPRLEGTCTVVMGFGGKVFNGVGVGLLGILLGAAGYNGALATQSDSAVFMIRCLYALIPLACQIIIIIFATALSKMEKMNPRIELELKERRAAAAPVQA